jgi:hypothetical protein
VVLLGVGLLWMNARNLIPSGEGNEDPVALWNRSLTEKPLDLFGIPEAVFGPLCSINAVVAGALLLLTAPWRSPKMGLFLLPAAGLQTLGPMLGVLEVGPLSPQLLCLAGGVGLALLGFLFGKDT